MRATGLACPYCHRPATFLPSSESIYHGRDYGPVWICKPCDAWCGCHPGTNRPLGRLANAELRAAKIRVHAAFDPIWKNRLAEKSAIDPRYTKGMARGGRYKRLAELLGIPKERCHIGEFDVELCMRAIAVCESGAMEKCDAK